MDEDESRRKRTLIQRIFRIGLIAIPLFLYGRYVYNTFRPCPKIKSYESGYRYASSNSLRQKVLKKLIKNLCNDAKTERSYNFDAAKRTAQQREDPCNRYDTRDKLDRLERSKRYSCKSERKFDTCGTQQRHEKTDENLREQHKKKRGIKKRSKTDADPCKALYDQETTKDPCIDRSNMTRTQAGSNQLATMPERSKDTECMQRDPNVAKDCMNPPLPNDCTPINIPPEVLDRLCRSYNETYQRIAQTLESRNDKISSGKIDVDPCDDNFHSTDPDTPYVIKNYASKNEANAESGDTAKESDPCDSIDVKKSDAEVENGDDGSREIKLPVTSAKAEALREQFWHSGSPPKSLTQGCKTPRKKART